jgi:hypothetical protein
MEAQAMTQLVPALPAGLPSVSRARLPAVYEAAKESLAVCTQMDECQDWADKAEALASYARQAGDDEMHRMADRIQARAIRRCGELLKEIEPKRGANQNISAATDTNVSVPTRKDAAQKAGLSHRQQHTALRVASVPKEEFDEAVESKHPPTITDLAERGKKPAPVSDLKGRDPRDFKACTAALGILRDFYSFAIATDPKAVVRGASAKERERVVSQVQPLMGWMSDLLSAIEQESR